MFVCLCESATTVVLAVWQLSVEFRSGTFCCEHWLCSGCSGSSRASKVGATTS